MHVAPNIRLSRIWKDTWQVDLIMIASSTGAFLVHAFLIRHKFDIPAIVPTVLGTAIAFFIGFNNNQAYDRWWEARKIWGMLVNDSRSWARSIINYVRLGDIKEHERLAIQSRMITRHIGFLYALKGALREADDYMYKNYLNEEEAERSGPAQQCAQCHPADTGPGSGRAAAKRIHRRLPLYAAGCPAGKIYRRNGYVGKD